MGTQSRLVRPLAIVTGASSGIGFELAKIAAERGYDQVIAADEPQINDAALALRRGSCTIDALMVDLAATAGVDKLLDVTGECPVAVLLANGGHGLGRAFAEMHRMQAAPGMAKGDA